MKTTTISSPLRVLCTSVGKPYGGLCKTRGKLHDGRRVVFFGDARMMASIAEAITRGHRAIGAWVEGWQIADIR